MRRCDSQEDEDGFAQPTEHRPDRRTPAPPHADPVPGGLSRGDVRLRPDLLAHGQSGLEHGPDLLAHGQSGLEHGFALASRGGPDHGGARRRRWPDGLPGRCAHPRPGSGVPPHDRQFDRGPSVLWNWYRRYDLGDAAVLPLGLILSAIVVLILLYTGWRGGEMVYRHRVGVSDEGESRVLH